MTSHIKAILLAMTAVLSVGVVGCDSNTAAIIGLEEGITPANQAQDAEGTESILPEKEEAASNTDVILPEGTGTPTGTGTDSEPEFRWSPGSNVSHLPEPTPPNLPLDVDPDPVPEPGQREVTLRCNTVPGGLFRCSDGEESFCTTLLGERRECPGEPVCAPLSPFGAFFGAGDVDRCREVGGDMSWCQKRGTNERVDCPVDPFRQLGIIPSVTPTDTTQAPTTQEPAPSSIFGGVIDAFGELKPFDTERQTIRRQPQRFDPITAVSDGNDNDGDESDD